MSRKPDNVWFNQSRLCRRNVGSEGSRQRNKAYKTTNLKRHETTSLYTKISEPVAFYRLPLQNEEEVDTPASIAAESRIEFCASQDSSGLLRSSLHKKLKHEKRGRPECES